jgi:HlyD family secretion protein
LRSVSLKPAAAGWALPVREEGSVGLGLENEKPKRVSITPGISDGTYTEVVSGDLKEGQNIIVEALKKGGKTQSPSGPRMF